MKKYVLTIILSALASMADAQLFSPLGKGIYNYQVAFGSNERDKVVSVTKRKINSDTLTVNLYDTKTKIWTVINTFSANQFNIPDNYCEITVGEGDTAYLSSYRSSSFELVVLKVYSKKVVEIAKFKGISKWWASNIYNINDKIVLTGIFDSMYFNGKWTFQRNAAYLDKGEWKSLPFTPNVPAQLKYHGDTIAFIDYDKKLLKRFTFNGHKDSFVVPMSGIGPWESFLNVVDNQFIINQDYWDTVAIIIGKSVRLQKLPETNAIEMQIAGVGNQAILKCGNGFLYNWKVGSDTLTPVYQFNTGRPSKDSAYRIINLDSGVVLSANKLENNFLYGNTDYGKLVMIDRSYNKPMAYDTVILVSYFDKDKDLKYSSNDEWIPSFYANISYREGPLSNRDLIPDFSECDYSLFWNVIEYNKKCVRLPFTGYLRSKNMSNSRNRDTLWFPFQECVCNVNVLSASIPRHRLRNTSEVDFTVSNSACADFDDKMALKILPPPHCKIVSTTPAATRVVKDTLIFEFTGSVDRQNNFSLKVTYDTLKHHMGDTVTYKAWIFTETQEDVSDNYIEFRPILVYSYDPNQKFSIPEGRVTRGLKEIQYHIDFENEGNDYAERVIIKDTLDTRVPVYAFQMVKASHPYTVSLQGNVVIWTFDKIYLTPKKQDSVKSKGFVNFVARINSVLREGDSIQNRASIYFDYNKPIITNFAVLFFPYGYTGSTTEVIRTAGWSLFPNPAEDVLTIGKLQGKRTFEIFNMQGRSVWKHQAETQDDIRIQVGSWSRGVYMMVDSEGTARKFILR